MIRWWSFIIDMMLYIPPLLTVCCHMVSSHLSFTLHAYQCVQLYPVFGLDADLHFAYAVT